MSHIRFDTDILHTRSSDLSVDQLKCKDLARGIVRLALQGKGMIEGRDPAFMKKNEQGELELAEAKSWSDKVLALTLHLVAMEGGERELTFIMNRWAQSDDKQDVQLVWTYAVLDEKTKMHCPFEVLVAGVTLPKSKFAYGRPLRSTPKAAAKRVLLFIAGRNHPARESKFQLAAAAFKAQGWVTDDDAKKLWDEGEAELKKHLGKGGRGGRGVKAARSIRT